MNNKLLLSLLFVGLLFTSNVYAYGATYVHANATSKYPMAHWMPIKFDGTYDTCKMGLVLENSLGEKVCTRSRGHAKYDPIGLDFGKNINKKKIL